MLLRFSRFALAALSMAAITGCSFSRAESTSQQDTRLAMLREQLEPYDTSVLLIDQGTLDIKWQIQSSLPSGMIYSETVSQVGVIANAVEQAGFDVDETELTVRGYLREESVIHVQFSFVPEAGYDILADASYIQKEPWLRPSSTGAN